MAGRRWRVEAHNNASGTRSWRLVAGRGTDRVRFTLARVVDAETAERCRRNMQVEEDATYGTGRYGRLFELPPEDAIAYLLDERGEGVFGPPKIDYGEMTTAEYHDAVYWPARCDPRSPIAASAGTQDFERYLWRHTGRDRAGRPRERNGLLDGELGAIRLRDLDRVGDLAFERWLTAQRDRVSARTLAVHRNAWSTLLSYARRSGHTQYKPEFFRLRGATRRARPPVDPLDRDEVVALLRVTGRDPTGRFRGPRGSVRRAMWAVAIGLGLRPGELRRMRWEDVRWGDTTLAVRGTKTAASRDTIPMTPLAARALEVLWHEDGEPMSGPCFYTTVAGHKRALGEYKNALARDAEAAGIQRHVTPYLLRHSFATIAFLMGVPKDVTRRIGRWTDNSMLDRVYARPLPSALVPMATAFDL